MCSECKKRTICKKICKKIEKKLPQYKPLNYVPLRDIGNLNTWNDRSMGMKTNYEEIIMIRQILHPLLKMDRKEGLIFIGKHYFGMDVEELSKIFKKKRSNIYHILSRVKRKMG